MANDYSLSGELVGKNGKREKAMEESFVFADACRIFRVIFTKDFKAMASDLIIQSFIHSFIQHSVFTKYQALL